MATRFSHNKFYVYILANRDQTKIPRRTKIGISEDPAYRIQTLKLHKIIYRGFEDLYLYGVYEVEDGKFAISRALEHAAHIHFKKNQCKERGFDGCTEFFNLEPEFAERFMLRAGARKVTEDIP